MKIEQRNKYCWIAYHKLINWICAWLDIIDAIITIITFTSYYGNFGMDLRLWSTKKGMEKRKLELEKKKDFTKEN